MWVMWVMWVMCVMFVIFVICVLKAIMSVLSLYQQGSFQPNWILVDVQFAHFEIQLTKAKIHLNRIAYAEHVGNTECYMCTIKER
jgi:hypothetical protein